eukprot:CAMPEP_0118658650 /NCGR_PEP_ID=MMETSP0785-20121206/14685_1 /TAXON_ID=91992 /ORGANISM="Bolidomonas pacifica, Strain CCMP 1866" /LENGTH=77 /DNA_ID=CAMNT_0006551689 /DNA_START=38 /DNA_END=268 /DNA_ORIENTATION=+
MDSAAPVNNNQNPPSKGDGIPSEAEIAKDYEEISKNMQKLDSVLLPLKKSFVKSISAVDDIGQLSHLLKRVADTIKD